MSKNFNVTYSCPVCGFDELEDPPSHYNICDSCGTEFENDDEDATVEELRSRWIVNGAKWFNTFAPPKEGWSPLAQIDAAGLSVSEDDRLWLLLI